MNTDIKVTTTNTFQGYTIKEYKGLVRGIIVRSPTITQGFFAGLKQMVGGSIGAYKNMCESARQQAYADMIDHASAVGANAVVGLRYETGSIGGETSGASEVLCYGTAVVIARGGSSASGAED
jgi:uncharacterized protein YbjQ (UPF0145 family)